MSFDETLSASIRTASRALSSVMHAVCLIRNREAPAPRGVLAFLLRRPGRDRASSDERRWRDAYEDFHDWFRGIQRRGALCDEGARRRAARRGQEGRQEGRWAAGGTRQHREDGAAGPGARRACARDGDRCRPRAAAEDLVRNAGLRERGREGGPLLPGLRQVQLPLLDARLPGPCEPRRRRHLAGGLCPAPVEPEGREAGCGAGEDRCLLTAYRPVPRGSQRPRRSRRSQGQSLASQLATASASGTSRLALSARTQDCTVTSYSSDFEGYR